VFTLAELEAAAALVHAAFPPTPQYAWPLLAQRVGVEVWVKHENHTPTGAFKVRGGVVFMERLKRENPNVAGVVSATRGNHGQSLAYAGARYGIPVTILVPRGNSAEKNNAMRAQGARLIEHGQDFDEAREQPRALRRRKDYFLRLPLHAIWCWGWRLTRWNSCAPRRRSPRFTCRLALGQAYAAASWRVIFWA
jgi:threonine dehydratase